MINKGNYVCDYCGGKDGNFYTTTGNHIGCQQDADKDARIKVLTIKLHALREAAREVVDAFNFTPSTYSPIRQEKALDALAALLNI